MNYYDDLTRVREARALRERTREGLSDVLNSTALHDALAVFVTDEKLRPVLEALDPKAVEQARQALLLV